MKGMAPCTAKNARMAVQAQSSRVTDCSRERRALVSCIDQRRAGGGHDGAAAHHDVFAGVEGNVEDIVGFEEKIGHCAFLHFFKGDSLLCELSVLVADEAHAGLG